MPDAIVKAEKCEQSEAELRKTSNKTFKQNQSKIKNMQETVKHLTKTISNNKENAAECENASLF